MKFLLIALVFITPAAGPTACVELQGVHLQIPIRSGPAPDLAIVALPAPQLQQPNAPQPPLPTEKPGVPPVKP